MISNLRQSIIEIGWKRTVLYLLSRAMSEATRGWARIEVFCLVAQPVPDQLLLLPGRGKRIDITEVSHEDPICWEFPRPAEVIQDRFRQDAHCFVARQAGRFVGFIWLIAGVFEEDVVRATFVIPESEKAVWDFDVYVEPHCRLGYAFSRLWDHAYGWMRDAGFRWSLSRISAFNIASHAAHQRLGARDIGSVCFVCFGKAQFTLSTVKPFLHLSWYKSRVIIRLKSPSSPWLKSEY
jgi:GNAT superfamily N-acetyltransferase